MRRSRAICARAAVALALASSASASTAAAQPRGAVAQASPARFHVPTIACESCANRIKVGLKKLAGVTAVEVDVAKKDVVVTYDASRIAPAAIKSELLKLGFEVT